MRRLLLLAATALAALSVTPALGATLAALDSGAVSGLGARNIGSATMSGRIAAIAAVREQGQLTLFVGAASGGVWRSTDGGTSFTPIFTKQPVQSIGAVAIDPSNPKTIWVGTGESWMRNSVSIGDGVYKSTDGGESWANVGLKTSEHVSKIIVDPHDSNTVYACVPGRLWSDSADRGLYKTSDGGRTWALVLKGANLSTGCSGLSMDPANSKVLFASTWDFRRKGWTFRSGGENADQPSGSGLFRTADGGASWTRLDATSAKGLPAGPWGRVAVTVAPSNAQIVYAFIESPRSALFRSDDGGRTWQERDRSQSMVWRPFYFANLIVDPTNPDRLFKPDLGLIVSEDGGKSFASAQGGTHGDHHDIWMDPTNPKSMISGDDGGLWFSRDGGGRWTRALNLPVSQFYHVSTDMKDPYQVYGGLQDNSAWVGDSAYPGGVTNSRWENLGGGDGFFAFADPSDPDYAYAESQGGELIRINRHTLVQRNIKPQAGYKEKLRFNWNTPLHLSPNDPGVIYIGSQFLFRSKDHGQSWDRISPDLTSNDPSKQKQEESGGVTVDNSAAEMHTTIYSISESPRDRNVIWVGTDDGKLQLTRDAGRNWSDLTGRVPGLPQASWVSWVEASRHAPGTAYAAFDRHTFGDMDSYLYRTTDFGQSWTRIAAPTQGVRGYVHVIKEDRLNPALLFMGTEFGLWVSIDAGGHWAQYKGGDIGSVAVRDIALQPRDDDLVLATHGRGIWVIDDISPLRKMTSAMLGADFAFVEGRPTQQRMEGSGGWPEGDATYAGPNPPDGAVINYYQAARPIFGKLKLEVLDPSGQVIDELPASKRRGLNRVVWSMRVKPPRVPAAASLAYNSAQGPRVPPGVYTVRATKAGQVFETKLPVGLDRRASYSEADRRAQYDAVMKAHALFGRASDLLDQINGIKRVALERAGKLPAGDPLKARLTALADASEAQRKQIVATKEGGAITGEERIREHLDQAYGALMSYEGRPGEYQVARIDALARELDDVARATAAMKTAQLDPVDAELRRRGEAGFTPAAIAQAALEARPNPFEQARQASSAQQERD